MSRFLCLYPKDAYTHIVENAVSVFTSSDQQSSEDAARIAHLERLVGRMAVAMDIEKKAGISFFVILTGFAVVFASVLYIPGGANRFPLAPREFHLSPCLSR